MPVHEHELTYVAADGTRQRIEYQTGRTLTARREKFCELVAYGAIPFDAYCEAYGKTIFTDAERVNAASSMRSILSDTDVKIRIQELRRPIQRKLAKKWEYTLDHALEDCQRAWDVAHADGDSKAMLKAIELRSKLTKILSEEVNVNHKHGLLDDETTEVLIMLREEMKRRKSRAKIIQAETVEIKGESDRLTPNTPLLG
jgi:hypothetical protein